MPGVSVMLWYRLWSTATNYVTIRHLKIDSSVVSNCYHRSWRDFVKWDTPDVKCGLSLIILNSNGDGHSCVPCDSRPSQKKQWQRASVCHR